MTLLMPREADGHATVDTYLAFAELHPNVALRILRDSWKGEPELVNFMCILFTVAYH